MYNLLKAVVLALVLASGSIQPGSPLYPFRMTVENMMADGATEIKPQMEFTQEQADEMQRPADDGHGDCPGGNCGPVRGHNRDDGCSGDDCDDKGFAQRVNTVIPDHESDCPGGNCGPTEDHDRDGTCDGDDCDPARDHDRDHDGTCDDCELAKDRDQGDTCPDGNCGGDQGGDSHEDSCPGGSCGGGNQDGGDQEDNCPGGDCGGDQGGDSHEDSCPGGDCGGGRGSGDQGGGDHDCGDHDGGGHH